MKTPEPFLTPEFFLIVKESLALRLPFFPVVHSEIWN